MTKKRFTMKGSTILENNEEITAWDCCDLLNELHEENVAIKQLIHTMLRQINVENIGDEHAVYSTRIVFTIKEWKLMNEIWEEI